MEILICCLYFSVNKLNVCVAENVSFSPVFPQNGYLADRKVVDLLHDSRGYLWMGTYDGLIRYDGAVFRCYSKDELHTQSSVICSIMEDSRGNVWVGTEGGICCYRAELGIFVALDTPDNDKKHINTNVRSIREDKDGLIWFSLKSRGIWSFNPQTGAFRNFLNGGGSDYGQAPRINSFVIDSNGSFIIAEYCNGLSICRQGSSKAEPLHIHGFDFSSDNIPCLVDDGRGCIYACSTTYGLCEIFPYAGKASVLVPLNKGVQPTDLSMDINTRTLYMSTSSGLYSYSLNDGVTTVYDRADTFGLPSDNFCCVGLDLDGNLLVGMAFGNLYYGSLKGGGIRKFNSLTGGGALTGARVRHFGERKNGDILVLTSSKGVLSLSARNRTLSEISFRGVPESCDDICVVGDTIFLSSASSLYAVDMGSGITKKYSSEDLGAEWLIDRPIYPIFPVDGKLCLGTALGVVTLDLKSGEVGHLPGLEECNVNGFCIDSDTLLVSTYAHGLVKYDLHERRPLNVPDAERLLGISGRRLTGVVKDGMGRVWIATSESGIVIVGSDGEIKHLDSGNTFSALNSDKVRSMRMDYSGRLWVATENGMTSISPDLGTYEHYSEADGLLNKSFISQSAFTASDGTMYFGSRDGFIAFRPDKAGKFRGNTPELYIDEVRVNNVLLVPGPGSELSSNIEHSEKIKLSHERNSLSFSFSRPALPSSSDGYIMCMMKGLDTEWVRLGPDNIFSCRSMPPGRYELLARSFSSSGQMEREHAPVEIVISPPFWRSTAAIIFYVLSLLGVLSAAALQLWKKLKREEAERYRRFTEEKLALTPERQMLRAAMIGQSPSAFLNADLSDGDRMFISRLDAVIEKNISDENLTYGLVAERLCVGKQSLNLKVKSMLGVTVSNYIMLYRLFASVPLLSEDDSRVNLVCFRVGFNTPSYFAKCFKNAFGMLPGEFREM